MRSESRLLLLPLLGAMALAPPARAQLDFGSPEVSAGDIEAYATPFYKLMASPLGSNRMLPDPGGPAWEVGLETILMPVPEGEPFENAARSVWPFFRAVGGVRLGRAAAGTRAMAWRDPRMGRTFLGGANLSYLLPLGRSAWGIPVQGGWDHLFFGSTYDFYYPGSIFSEGETVPGDYTLKEDAWGTTAGLLYRRALWKLYARGGPEWTSARFRYLYYPSGQSRQETRSSKSLRGWRTEAGAGWRGFRLEGGYLFGPYLNAGWTWGMP